MGYFKQEFLKQYDPPFECNWCDRKHQKYITVKFHAGHSATVCEGCYKKIDPKYILEIKESDLA
jgi:transcription elongation factor Elf1